MLLGDPKRTPRNRRGLFGARQSFLLPLEQAAVKDVQVLLRHALVLQIEEEPRRHIAATLVVHHDLLAGCDSPGLQLLLSFLLRQPPEAISEEVIRICMNRARDMCRLVLLGRRRIQQQHVGLAHLLAQPLNIRKMTAQPLLRNQRTRNPRQHYSATQPLRHTPSRTHDQPLCPSTRGSTQKFSSEWSSD